MNLDTYLWKNRMTQRQFGNKIGLDQTRIHRLVNGKDLPRLHLARKVVEITEGEVTYDDLIAEYDKYRQKKKKKL